MCDGQRSTTSCFPNGAHHNGGVHGIYMYLDSIGGKDAVWTLPTLWPPISPSALHWIMANDYAVELLQCYMYLEDFSLSRSTNMCSICLESPCSVYVWVKDQVFQLPWKSLEGPSDSHTHSLASPATLIFNNCAYHPTVARTDHHG